MGSACAFTGHRPKSFPWKYDETAPGCILLKKALTAQITALSGRGFTNFLSGMALGVDLWCAEIVLTLRQSDPSLKLHCILPCEEQDANWSTMSREKYRHILDQANEVVYVSRAYSRDCMLARNRYLVEHSPTLLAVYNGTVRSGTGATVRYARKLGKELYILDPVTCEIKHEPAR